METQMHELREDFRYMRTEQREMRDRQTELSKQVAKLGFTQNDMDFKLERILEAL